MEGKFLQSIKKSIKDKKLPNLEEMSRDELVLYIEENQNIKNQLVFFIKTVYFATQQSFYDVYQSGEDVEFDILEGRVHYDPNTGVYTFVPNNQVKKLISNAEEKNITKLKEVLSSRFYKMVEYIYNYELCGKIDKNKKEN